MSETCLIARDVSMSLSGHERRFCLRVPNFALKRGQARALTGESGSGKTLFLETTDAFFEDTLDFTLGNDPANALRYYARAADAGHPGASQFVETMCESLYARPVRSDTDAAALQSHCPTP